MVNYNLQFKDKIVLITGALGQLGSELCIAYKKLGATVVGTDLSESSKVILDQKSLDLYFQVDISKKNQVAECLRNVVEKYGRIDILVNNAGVSCFEPFEERPEESFDWVMDVNLKGTFFCCQKFYNLAKEKGFKGNILNIGSVYGVISPDFRIYTDCERKNSEVYGATKAGIIQMTKYFAVHMAGAGIRVNCVSPGGILNRQNGQGEDFINNYSFRNPMKRMAFVEEIVGGVLYFTSDLASYTNGQNLTIDGGMTSW